jgi:hypothetical protein
MVDFLGHLPANNPVVWDGLRQHRLVTDFIGGQSVRLSAEQPPAYDPELNQTVYI